MQKNKPSLLLILALWAVSCGTEVGNPKKPGGGGTGTQQSIVLDDATARTEVVAAQLDDVLSAAAEDAPDAAGLALFNLDADLTKTCTETDDGHVTVKKDRHGPIDRDLTKALGTYTYHAEVTENTTNDWHQTDHGLSCRSDKQGLALKWAAAEGLTLHTTVAREREWRTAFTSRRGVKRERNGYFKATGERSISWGSVKATETEIGLTKTLTSKMTRALKVTRTNKQVADIASIISIKDDAPLKIEISRDLATEKVNKRTIHSGTVISEQEEDSRLETTYRDVVLGAESECLPSSGQVEGKMYRFGTDTAEKTYTVTFDADGATITFSDGTTADYVPDCVED